MALTNIREVGLDLYSEGGIHNNYQQEIHQISFRIKDNEDFDGLIQVYLNDEPKLIVKSDLKGYNKLGQSFLNFFGGDVAINDHFQLDYYDGNGILLPTDISMIFLASG